MVVCGGGHCSQSMRDVTYTIENPRHFVDSHHQKPVNAIIEHVRDGSVVRALLLPDYYLVTVMLSGIKVRPWAGPCLVWD
ncbi:Hypothetical predicted protein, partial [Marmota monax]